jgi:hypothetical protein
VPVWTYWPVVHPEAGEATTAEPWSAATLAGGVEPAGVQDPGIPAVAPVAGTTGGVVS